MVLAGDAAVGVGVGTEVAAGSGGGSVLSGETPGVGVPGIVLQEVRRILLMIARAIQRR